ncbi:MAG: formamidopyrimidine-DNA glycosylase [Euryarchaeota archaeon]|nr:formamidopyrimidine-DNA glycosylase [Euryarchaeota archaeon]
MPELPDITVYVEALERRVVGRRVESVRIASPFLVRTVEPAPSAMVGRTITRVFRLGKRIVFAFDDGVHCIIHLMIAGRFHWRKTGAKLTGRNTLAGLDFENGTLLVTEASSKKRASLHMVTGIDAALAFAPAGVEPLEADRSAFTAALRRENHTLKRALTDPRILSGVGNAYSDEILHRARLSPVKLTQRLEDEEAARLHAATREVLVEWTGRLRKEVGEGFPEKVTAFRDGMAVHGRYKEPCPVCGSSVQRIVSGENEANYCATCQTGGKLLADRALSRLLREDWPKTLDEMNRRLKK